MKTIQPDFLFPKKNVITFPKFYMKRLIVAFVAIICLQSVSRSQTGEMLAFDGADDFVDLGNLLPSGSYTKEAWINANSWGGSIGSIISGDASAFWAPNGRLRAGHDINNVFNDVQAPPASFMLTGSWYHVAVTYDATLNQLTLYQDGVQVAQGPASLTYSETGLYIAAFRANRVIDPNNPQSVFDGSIDEVRIWNVVRTAAEIANSRNCILTGDEFGLVAYYDLNQGTADGNNPTEDIVLDRRDACIPNNGTIFNMNLGGAGGSNWSAPGAGVTGACGGTFQNINLSGNSLCITDGDASPSTADHTDFEGGTSRTFTITNTGSATLNITSVTFTGPNAGDFAVTQAPAASLAPAASTTFTVTLTPTANATYNATVNVNNDDGDNESIYSFNITTIFATLPVNLKAFTVNKSGSQSVLNWTTATETNNAGFYILRSTDGRNWFPIGYVAGAGTTTSERSYSFTDPSPKKGVNYYRIKQVDLDAKETFSQIRSVTFASESTLVYPVPTFDKIVIELSDARLIGSQATLSDQQGKVLRQITITGMQQEISLSKYPAGFYLLRMDDGNTYKLIKQ